MGWRIIEVNKNCHVKLFLDNLVISGDEKITIPINNVDLILFTNNRTNISVNSINKLAINNVACIFCNELYKPTSQLIPFVGNHATIVVFRKQLEWTQKWKDRIRKVIVKQKIINQFDLIKNFKLATSIQIDSFQSYIDEIIDGDPQNKEGHAAKLYWFLLFGIEFKRSDDLSIVNALLNFGYTVLNSMICRSIVKKGLDPRISIFHKAMHNHFALSSDLIEPFRMIVDLYVYTLYDQKLIKNDYETLTKLFKQSLIDFISNFKVMINGYYQYTNNAIDIYIDHLIEDKLSDLTMKYNLETKINEMKDEL